VLPNDTQPSREAGRPDGAVLPPDVSVADVSPVPRDGGLVPKDGGLVPKDGAADSATHRTSLGVCWTDATCRRALLVSHGGDWTLTVPYGSHTAFQAAYDNGADAIKCDLRLTKDGVAVAAHSSPIQIYESLDCVGQRIEDMTAAQATACHLLPSQDTIQRIDDVLAWARGKIIIMLTVKLPGDLAGGIATALAAGAQDYVFFETNPTDFQKTIPAATGWDQLHYLVNIGATSDIDLMLDTVHDPRAFMYEMTPSYPNATAQQVTDLINTRLHPAGVRAFAATAANPLSATVQNHLDLFNQGFDVVMSYNLANGVTARVQVNQARGISPP
jgi:glycerophosphoryl diester phosphodiesterase